MAERKALSKSVRFEVFKRDLFKCQYCGRGVNETILEVDHITPIAEGGTNDMMNLITSCRDCNRGKGKRKLTDKAEAIKESKYLEEEQARLEQSQMVIEWKKQLLTQRESEVDAINEYIGAITDFELTEYGRQGIRNLINRFSFSEVYDATEISFTRYYIAGDKYSWEKAFKKIGGVCFNRRKQNEKDN